MSFFATRFAVENPGRWGAEGEALLQQELKVYDLAEGNRTQFLNKATERLRTIAARLSPID
jgi:hypothetical protein